MNIPFHINPYHIKWLLLLIHSMTHCGTPLEARPCQDPSDRSSPLVQLMDDRRWDLGYLKIIWKIEQFYPNSMVFFHGFSTEIHKHGVFHWGVSPVFRQSHRNHVVDVVQTLSKVSFLLYRHHLFVLQGGGVIMGLWHILVGGLEHELYFPQ